MKIQSSLAGLYMAASVALPAQAADRQIFQAPPEVIKAKCGDQMKGFIVLDVKKTDKDIEYTSLSCFFGTMTTGGNCESAAKMIGFSRRAVKNNPQSTWNRTLDEFSRFVIDNCPTI